MSLTGQFSIYAKEAILAACAAKTDADRQGLLEMARTWMQRSAANSTSGKG